MAGKIHHWKHGWIPLDDFARAEKEGGVSTVKRRADRAAVALLAKKQAVEPAATAHLQEAASQTGGTMVGLPFRLKSRESLTRKLVTKAEERGTSPEAEASRVGDALRYTMTFPHSDYTSGVKRATAALEARGYRVEAENNWPRGVIYKGVNTEVTSPTGEVFELQFHTPESFVQKEAQHVDYETMRDPAQPAAARRAAYERMARNWNNIPVPPAVDTIGKVLLPRTTGDF